MTNKIDNTLQERGSRYGTFGNNAQITQDLCDVIKQGPSYDRLLPEHIEAFHMIFHKIARCVCGDPMYIDNIHDIVGYAKLLEDFLKEQEEKPELANGQSFDDEVLMLIHGFQGKFGPNFTIECSQTAMLKFREKLRNGEI